MLCSVCDGACFPCLFCHPALTATRTGVAVLPMHLFAVQNTASGSASSSALLGCWLEYSWLLFCVPTRALRGCLASNLNCKKAILIFLFMYSFISVNHWSSKQWTVWLIINDLVIAEHRSWLCLGYYCDYLLAQGNIWLCGSGALLLLDSSDPGLHLRLSASHPIP